MIYGCFHAMMLELSSCDNLYSLQSLVRKHLLNLVPGDRVSIVDGFLWLLLKFVKGLVGGVMSLSSTPVYLKHGHLLRAPDQAKKFQQSLETCFLLWSGFTYGTHCNFEIAIILWPPTANNLMLCVSFMVCEPSLSNTVSTSHRWLSVLVKMR